MGELENANDCRWVEDHWEGVVVSALYRYDDQRYENEQNGEAARDIGDGGNKVAAGAQTRARLCGCECGRQVRFVDQTCRSEEDNHEVEVGYEGAARSESRMLDREGKLVVQRVLGSKAQTESKSSLSCDSSLTTPREERRLFHLPWSLGRLLCRMLR